MKIFITLNETLLFLPHHFQAYSSIKYLQRRKTFHLIKFSSQAATLIPAHKHTTQPPHTFVQISFYTSAVRRVYFNSCNGKLPIFSQQLPTIFVGRLVRKNSATLQVLQTRSSLLVGIERASDEYHQRVWWLVG